MAEITQENIQISNGPLGRSQRVEHAVDDEHLRSTTRKKFQKASSRDIGDDIEF